MAESKTTTDDRRLTAVLTEHESRSTIPSSVIRHPSSACFAPSAEHVYDLFELGGVFELLVDGGKSHVGDLVQGFEPVHHHVADLFGFHLALQAVVERALDVLGNLF